MSRTSTITVCEVCGAQARRTNYTTKVKGKTYRYLKFIHRNGVAHYFRLETPETGPQHAYGNRMPIADTVYQIIEARGKNETQYAEIKASLSKTYDKSIGTATIYRNINKLLKRDMITKRVDKGKAYYSKRFGSSAQDVKTTTMSIGFDFTDSVVRVTSFAHILNSGSDIATKYIVPLPVDWLKDVGDIEFKAFDIMGEIALNKDSIPYASYGQSVISLNLNAPLRKQESTYLFWIYYYNFKSAPIRTMIMSNIGLLRVNCKINRDEDVDIEKVLLDGIKTVEATMVKTISTGDSFRTVEAQFEEITKGEIISIHLKRQK